MTIISLLYMNVQRVNLLKYLLTSIYKNWKDRNTENKQKLFAA